MSDRIVRVAIATAPFVFVFLWSTGFIGARLTMPHAEPMTFLTLRFGVAALIMFALSVALGTRWPPDRRTAVHAMVAGLLIHAVYLGGVFVAVRSGLEAGAAALIVGAQPILTAALSGPVLGESVTRRKWLGLALGAAGVVIFVGEKLGLGVGTPASVAFCVLALVGISVGTVYQKRYVSGVSIVSSAAIQYAVSGIACLWFALTFEHGAVEWSGRFVFGFLWLTLVLSIGAVSLLYALIRTGEAANVASLFFLVPPCAALIAWLLFGETLGPFAMGGMVLVAVGVALVNTGARKAPEDEPGRPGPSSATTVAPAKGTAQC